MSAAKRACAIEAWIGEILKSYTIPTRVIELSTVFVEYLEKDGIILPGPEEFVQLRQEVDAILERFGGVVFPKLNWSAPKDATWVFGETLQCKSFEDVVLLIKSSEFIYDDLDQCRELGIQPKLCLRKWSSLFPSREFRCFVSNNSVVGICQRQARTFFQTLLEEKDDLSDAILHFLEEIVVPGFSLEKYVVDVYIDRNLRVWIVDFGPWLHGDAILFDWQELCDLSQRESFEFDTKEHFRIIESSLGILPRENLFYRLPQDILDYAITLKEQQVNEE
jgi:hypothetical protein